MVNAVPARRVEMDTARGVYRPALASSSSAGSFSAARQVGEAGPQPSATICVLNGQRNLLALVPFGTGADTNTISIRVIGWSRVVNADGKAVGWAPSHLCTIQATLTTGVNGAAGVTPGGTDDHFADAISVVDGDTDAVKVKPGVADVSPAWVLIDALGFEKIEIEPIDDGSATAANALVRAL